MTRTARRPLGRTAIEVTRLGLGTAPIGNLFSAVRPEQAAATVAAARRAGLSLFDTAPQYGHGLAEERLGAALAGEPRDELVISTKVGRVLEPAEPGEPAESSFVEVPPLRPVFDFSADGVRRSLDDSLERLGLDRVDIVHVHDPDDHADPALAEAFPVLHRLRDEGVIGAVGAGMNQAALLARFVREGAVDCVLLAGRYTLLDQTGADELLPLCQAAGVGVLLGGVFNSGLLADPTATATYDYRPASPEVLARARSLEAVCARHGVPLPAAALQFAAAHPAVTALVVGARSPAEVDDAVRLFALPLPADLWSELVGESLLPRDAITPRHR